MLSFLFPQGLDTGKFLFQKASSETPMCLLFYVSLEGCVVCAQTPGVPFSVLGVRCHVRKSLLG